MGNLPIDAAVRYVTNDAGERTDVLVPLEVWEKILNVLQAESGLEPVDEAEPVGQILADLQAAVLAARAGETAPLKDLWQDIDRA